jgi:saccharopine dehydrogenase (NAD+, L-lysine-forming)
MFTVLLIGATGNTGKKIASLLMRCPVDLTLLIGGRNRARLSSLQNSLLHNKPKNKGLHVAEMDVADPYSCTEYLEEADLVINCSSAVEHAHLLYEHLINSHTHYFDTNLSFKSKHEKLKEISDRVKCSNLIFVTDCGYHPGIPAAMIRWAANKSSQLKKANCYAVMKLDWRSYSFSRETGHEMISEFRDYEPVYYDHEWKTWSWMKSKKYDFGSPFGMQNVTPMMLNELRKLPTDYTHLEETGFFISGFNAFTDYFMLPFILLGTKFPGLFSDDFLTNVFLWSVKKGGGPFGVRLIGDFDYGAKKVKMILSHNDPYLLTAIPVVACFHQLIEGRLCRGVHYQGSAVDPNRFFKLLRHYGIDIKVLQ